jgi:TetR/AcrR family transcriptional repressor of nem operon
MIKLASKRFREEGLAGIGIAELMKEAGLTVGGSYEHFKSRDDLVAESVGSAPGFWKRQVETAASGGRPVPSHLTSRIASQMPDKATPIPGG